MPSALAKLLESMRTLNVFTVPGVIEKFGVKVTVHIFPVVGVQVCAVEPVRLLRLTLNGVEPLATAPPAKVSVNELSVDTDVGSAVSVIVPTSSTAARTRRVGSIGWLKVVPLTESVGVAGVVETVWGIAGIGAAVIGVGSGVGVVMGVWTISSLARALRVSGPTMPIAGLIF